MRLGALQRLLGLGLVIVGIHGGLVFGDTPEPVEDPLDPIPGREPAPLDRVPGKEVSLEGDRSASPTANPIVPYQTLVIDGNGGSADGFLYRGAILPIGGEVDAMSAGNAPLVRELLENNSALFFSIDNDLPNLVDGGLGSGVIYGRGADVTDAITIGLDPGSVQNMNPRVPPEELDPAPNVDAIDLFGPDLVSNAEFFSIEGDVDGTAVYQFDAQAGTTSRFLSRVEIANAIGLTPSAVVDIDAMVFSLEARTLIFSLDEDPDLGLTGGEIYVWNIDDATTGAARFLNFGGIVWDSSFEIRPEIAALLGVDSGRVSGNINALSIASIPEPSSLLLLVLGGSGLVVRWLGHRRRGR